MTWTLHVEEDFSSAHHNGPPGHKCNAVHGHDWKAVVEITYEEVDAIGWGPDFGGIKALIKPLDHNDLNEMFDFPPSAENIAKWLYDRIRVEVLGNRAEIFKAHIDYVEVHEGGGNKVTYRE